MPVLGLAMWLAALLAPLSLPFAQRPVVHRLRWFIGAYTALVAAFRLLARHPLSPAQAAAWSSQLRSVGAGEALDQALRSQFRPYLALVIWGVLPLTYFGWVVQQLGVQRHLLRAPSTRPEHAPGSYEPYRDATLLLPEQLAAYTAPTLFEEGAAERLACETTHCWRTQTVVLDFGAGWRKLLNAPELAGHVEVWQLQPGGQVPFRWNPWQVGRRIRPERQLAATCELFRNAGRMGERQLGHLRRAAQQMWRKASVFTTAPEIDAAGVWAHVQPHERDVLASLWPRHGITGRRRGAVLRVTDLTPPEQHAPAP